MSQVVALNTEFIEKSLPKIAIVDQNMNKQEGNGHVPSYKTMCTSPKENELNMSYHADADDETEGNVSAIDAKDDMLNLTAIDESNVTEAVKQYLPKKYVYHLIVLLLILTLMTRR